MIFQTALFIDTAIYRGSAILPGIGNIDTKPPGKGYLSIHTFKKTADIWSVSAIFGPIPQIKILHLSILIDTK